MTCHRAALPGGGHAIVCSRSPRPQPQRCHLCGEPAAWRCDHPLPGGSTCDRPLCDAHRHPRAAADLCPSHAAEDRRCGTCAHCRVQAGTLERWCVAGKRPVPVLHAWVDAQPACGPVGRWWRPAERSAPAILTREELAERAEAAAAKGRRRG